MKNNYCIKNSCFNDIYNNAQKYFQIFLENGLICFKQIFLNIEEQEIITKKFADMLKCQYVSPNDIENHAFSFLKNGTNLSKNEIFIDWHLEHIRRTSPQVAASWNMIKLECSKECGNTGFVNSNFLYEKMPLEWQLFLGACSISDQNNELNIRDCIQNHRITGKKIIRIEPSLADYLIKINQKTPSLKDYELFNTIRNWYINEIKNNKDIQIWWQWSIGDFIIPDLSLMIHCVKGGFLPNQREFSRHWIFVKESDNI